MKDKFHYGSRVLITGGRTGIGRKCARYFAQRGYQVFAASRSAEEKSEAIGSGNLHGIAMDVTNEESVKRAMSLIGSCDIVIHCAGMGIAGAAEDTPIEDARAQFETNYFGVLRVNRHVLPGMRERGRGLIVVIGSVAGRISVPFQTHYSSTKAALEAYCEGAREELRPYGVKVCIIEPGDTKTAFTASRKRCFPDKSPYLERGGRSVDKMERDEQSGRQCITVAKAVSRVMSRRNPPLRRAVGIDYQALLFAKRFLPDSLTAWIVGRLYAK